MSADAAAVEEGGMRSPTRMTTLQSSEEENQNKSSYCTPVELSEADERMKRFYGKLKNKRMMDFRLFDYRQRRR